MRRLAILGASGHGKVIADAALLSNEWDKVEFFDDAHPDIKFVETWSVIGNTNDLIMQANQFQGVVVAIGSNDIRLCKQRYLSQSGCQITSIVHPSAIVSPRSTIHQGTVVMAGAVINPFSVIGEACIINTNSVIEHDCILSSGVHISPGCLLAGSVSVGSGSWIGIGASVKQLISICNNVIVGAGAIVVKNIKEQGTYVGNPARKLF